jgi:hypothetical protein
MNYKSTKQITLASYLSDTEGGPLTIEGSYSFVPSGSGSSSSGNIPGGIFSWSSANTLGITSTSYSDVGIYTITLTANDEQLLTSASASFILTVSNKPPKLVNENEAPPDINLVHK